MRKLAVIVLGVVMLSAAPSDIASAQQYPSVSKLTPFSASADYMSQAGYFRYGTRPGFQGLPRELGCDA